MRMLFARCSDDSVDTWFPAGYFEGCLGDDDVPGIVAAGPFLTVGAVADCGKCWFFWVLLVFDLIWGNWRRFLTGVSVGDIAAQALSCYWCHFR
jgi:hypothetical protein